MSSIKLGEFISQKAKNAPFTKLKLLYFRTLTEMDNPPPRSQKMINVGLLEYLSWYNSVLNDYLNYLMTHEKII